MGEPPGSKSQGHSPFMISNPTKVLHKKRLNVSHDKLKMSETIISTRSNPNGKGRTVSQRVKVSHFHISNGVRNFLVSFNYECKYEVLMWVKAVTKAPAAEDEYGESGRNLRPSRISIANEHEVSYFTTISHRSFSLFIIIIILLLLSLFLLFALTILTFINDNVSV